MGNYHVPFWRAVGRATSSLTLIIRDEALLWFYSYMFRTTWVLISKDSSTF